MKKSILSLLILLAFSFVIKAQQPTINWAGKYNYEEEPVKANAGYGMVMDWDVTITKKGTGYVGTVEINGQQTGLTILADIKVDKNTIVLTFNKQTDGLDEHFKKGDVLFTLKRIGTKTITQWGVLTPRLLEKYPKECTCFIKK